MGQSFWVVLIFIRIPGERVGVRWHGCAVVIEGYKWRLGVVGKL